MTFPYTELRQKLVDHLLWLETLDPIYATWALDQYRREPSGLYRDLLADIKAEKARRAMSPESAKATSSTPLP